MLLLTILSAAAIAQDHPDIEMPDLNAQAFRPTIDGRSTLWTDDASLARAGTYSLRLAMNWAHNPLVVRWSDDSTTSLVRDTVNLDLMAGITIWRIRAGLDLPLYLVSTSDLDAGGAGLGDVAVDVRGSILAESEDAPIGLAAYGRVALPTATVDTALGNPGMGGELGLVASKQLTDQLLLAANLGTRFLPETQLVNVEVDDQLYYRLGGGYALTDDAGVSLDVAGHLNYNQPFGNAAANPFEGLLGGWYHISDDLILRGGVGHGFTRGISSPDVRVVAMIGWEPEKEVDTDLDGLVDSVDACPEQPEDVDGWEDKDGCPDPGATVTVAVVDEAGEPVPGADARVTGPETFQGGDSFSGEVHPGAYRAEATAEGWEPATTEFEVAAAQDQTVTVVLTPKPALVQVKVLDPDGKLMDATFTIGENNPVATKNGLGQSNIAPGSVSLQVRAEGFAVINQSFKVGPGETKLVEVQMRPTQVELTVEKIEIKGEVYFDTAKAVIKAESFPLLDEVAQVLLDHPEVLRLRIEGHTDSRGDAGYNLQLSKERAASVMTYLTEKGVATERLESEGYGESKPLVRGNNEKAWSKNRRVDFFVAEWDEAQRTKKVE